MQRDRYCFTFSKKAENSALKIETIGRGKLRPIALFFRGSKKDAPPPPKKRCIKRRYMYLLYSDSGNPRQFQSMHFYLAALNVHLQ